VGRHEARASLDEALAGRDDLIRAPGKGEDRSGHSVAARKLFQFGPTRRTGAWPGNNGLLAPARSLGKPEEAALTKNKPTNSLTILLYCARRRLRTSE
jgi:hypothetical protein